MNRHLDITNEAIEELHSLQPTDAVPSRVGSIARQTSPSNVSPHKTIWASDSPDEALVAPAGKLNRFATLAKRVADIVGAAILLLLLSPFMVVTWLVLMVTTKGRPLFRQTRLGECGRPFVMYKFQSMVPNAEDLKGQVANEQDGPIFKNACDPRITPVGRVLRCTSIDEIPQLFNVLTGHMSLVGPRPPLACEVVEYEPWQLARLSVKPGLTCLWQVSGRSEVGFNEWMEMDLWYVENQSLMTDLKLLLRTPWSVLSRRGAF
jgi:lipopolysaccharide/colanic/teichoic acid biosynthesis glycosyltransferase